MLLEHRIYNKLRKSLPILLIIIFSIVGLLCRLSLLDFRSTDARGSLLPWFQTIQLNGGFAALREQTGDYNIPYQTIIAFLTYLPGEPLYLIKFVSFFFDFSQALVCGGFAMALLGRKSVSLFAMVYGVILLLPTSILNSAAFAQCDSIYSTFALLCLWMLYRRKWIPAYFFFGIAFAFKQQVIFLLPFLLFHYVMIRRYTILHFLLIPGALYLLCLPAICLGRSWLDPITIYISQTKSYPSMWLNFPSFWSLVGNDYGLNKIAILSTFAILIFGCFMLLKKRIPLVRPGWFIKTTAWVMWTCLLFLPAMHERYGYLLDLVLVLVMLTDRSCWVFPAVTLVTSTLTYGYFLFGNSGPSIQFLSLLYLSAYLWFSYRLITGQSGKPVLSRLEKVYHSSKAPDYPAK